MKYLLHCCIIFFTLQIVYVHSAVLQRIGNSNDFLLIEQVTANDSKIDMKPNETVFVKLDLRKKSARQDEDGESSGLGAFNSIEGFLLSTLTGSIFAEIVPGNVGNTIKRIYEPINKFVEPFVKNFVKANQPANATATTATKSDTEEEDRDERAFKIRNNY